VGDADGEAGSKRLKQAIEEESESPRLSWRRQLRKRPTSDRRRRGRPKNPIGHEREEAAAEQKCEVVEHKENEPNPKT
jgi:hypothetical protein